MNATTLKTLYEAQLAEDIEPPVPAHVDERAIRWMRHLSRRMPAGELKEPNPSRVWIWSDLHLGHAESIMYFGRPFTSPEEMDDALFRSWQHTVAPGDTIICLGDVAIGGLSDNRLKRLRSAPGRKILVVGNHDINPAGLVDGEGAWRVAGRTRESPQTVGVGDTAGVDGLCLFHAHRAADRRLAGRRSPPSSRDRLVQFKATPSERAPAGRPGLRPRR